MIFYRNIDSNLPETDRFVEADEVLIQDSSNNSTNVKPQVDEMNNSSDGSTTNTSDIEQLDFESHFNNENTISNTETFYLNIGNIFGESPSQGDIEKSASSYHFAKLLSFSKDVSN